jgi:hypothetical protein
VKVRESQNGFNAIVHNTLPNSFEPQCMDAEVSRTRLPVYLREAELTAQGKTREEIDRAIAEGYVNGTLRAPTRTGVDWMLSPQNVVPTGHGGVAPYRPHLMISVPYLTNADLGTELNPKGQAFVVQEGTPGALLIVPVIPEAADVGVGGAPHVH